jgi:hypothetical protein
MLSGHCFSVTCKNQSLCEVVTARSSGYRPQIAYIYARSNTASHETSSKAHTKGQNSEQHNQTDKTTDKNIHNHRQDGSNEDTNAKSQNVIQISRSKYRKKTYKTKKQRRRKKHRERTHESNQAKLKRMYAKERILLRKLSLLKLRMEMVMRQIHGGDKNAKDNVLSEAFEYEPEVSKTNSLKTNMSFSSKNENKTERTSKNKLSNFTKLKFPGTLKNSTERPRNERKRPKTDLNFQKNENVYPSKLQKQLFVEGGEQKNAKPAKQSFIQNNADSKEGGKTLQKESFPSVHESESTNKFKIEDSSSPLVKDTGGVINKEKLRNFGLPKFQNMTSRTSLGKQGIVKKSRKQFKTIIEERRKSFGKENHKNNSVSLEEMISQTTESKDSEKIQQKTVVRWKNKTVAGKEHRNETTKNGNSMNENTNRVVNIVPNNSPLQSKEPVYTKTLQENHSFVSAKVNTRSQDRLYPQHKSTDLMLLDSISSEAKENNDSTIMVNSTDEHSLLPRYSSPTVFHHYRRDNP